MKKTGYIFLFLFLVISTKITGQNSKINWISFQQLEDSLKIKPKKVFISFYADWCTYCKKMDRTAFKNKEVIHILNSEYYAIKMNTESKETIFFDAIKYSNKQLEKSRRPTHEIPLLLAKRKGKPFTLPVNLILDKNFRIVKRRFNYISPEEMIKMLKEF
ncbi:thioredoxin family protein [Polaribacter sp.]|uniref:thioredoxin family protein n=1 Tax=Polaribacter sp. TaxID=1920175 RepID=UPI003F6D15A6